MFFGQSIVNNEEEVTQESMTLMMEAMLLDLPPEELEAFTESFEEVDAVLDEDILTEASIVKLDRNAKLSKLRKMAVFTVAKEKKDPFFAKLLKVWSWERFLENKLEKKYGNEATRRARKAASKASRSKSKTLKTVARKADTQFKGTKYSQKNNPKPKFSLNSIGTGIR